MTGAWKGGLALSNVTSIGAVTSANSSGTALVGSSSTFTKGAWAQLVAATTSDISWILVYGETVTSTGTAFAIDIGIGGSGSESVVINNLNFSRIGGASFSFPVMIPAGTRIAARFASSTGNDSFRVLLQGFSDTYQSAGTGSAIDTYGFATATNLGTLIDPGTSANTKGVYAQITSSTAADCSGFVVALDAQGTSGSVGTVQWLIDIAVGSAGAEVVILPNLYQIGNTSGRVNLYGSPDAYFPIQIPAGSRISARAQCTTATSPDRRMGITIYGVRY